MDMTNSKHRQGNNDEELRSGITKGERTGMKEDITNLGEVDGIGVEAEIMNFKGKMEVRVMELVKGMRIGGTVIYEQVANEEGDLR